MHELAASLSVGESNEAYGEGNIVCATEVPALDVLLELVEQLRLPLGEINNPACALQMNYCSSMLLRRLT